MLNTFISSYAFIAILMLRHLVLNQNHSISSEQTSTVAFRTRYKMAALVASLVEDHAISSEQTSTVAFRARYKMAALVASLVEDHAISSEQASTVTFRTRHKMAVLISFGKHNCTDQSESCSE
ncbi:hypothetical protein A265_01822 (plasmid) [Zymomonas mobilis subsp. mobilis str. CP4 = NRRL B-14023]|uniref:Uncharacterized protein n=1 Tax=Zymomonas mobilis subsp. mobilis (strain ATCC 31821 / ZM4 / CP4) TaxID=264203 RepID=A0A806CZU2_ZYMMO|nr:hypothetical protein ZZM4_0005 [Zymomonas mobilis subsp. mobilis ZM4 = ATCC 31821]AHB11054.1 hypothetical protein ZCP4_1791 [Zymomonas mobilis subsp. mobilis str. CP4 = NRRL B-14023]AHJ71420.1 hypothetical protein A254_01835 [Zymomonas mobilis subsp. mobilis NRRL B-12526]AVZ26878.1 hypothetical protein ZMO2_ZMOp36x021 [Zymomonas mobilis subsp. mobilis]AHJ73261.1 hypothetical protein A265_01822 [Zymomonas mobilis subsp. mobilis str. CP4 = NRRL B-14023]